MGDTVAGHNDVLIAWLYGMCGCDGFGRNVRTRKIFNFTRLHRGILHPEATNSVGGLQNPLDVAMRLPQARDDVGLFRKLPPQPLLFFFGVC